MSAYDRATSLGMSLPVPNEKKPRRFMTAEAPKVAARLADLGAILDNQIGHYKRMSAAHALDKQGVEAVKALTQIAQLLETQQSREYTKLNEALDSMSEAELAAAEAQVLQLVGVK